MLENEKKRIAENNSSKKAQVGESDLSGITMNERIERVRARRKEMTREMVDFYIAEMGAGIHKLPELEGSTPS